MIKKILNTLLALMAIFNVYAGDSSHQLRL